MANVKKKRRGSRVDYGFKNFPEYQLPSALMENHTAKELRAEYRKLRIEAQARLRAFEGTKYEKNFAYQNNKQFLTGATTPSKLNKRQLAAGLTELVGFLESKSGTVAGARAIEKAEIRAFHDKHKMTWLNRSNFDEFTRFLEWVRELQGDPYSFSEVVALYRAAKYSKLPIDRVKQNFDFYRAQIDREKDPNAHRIYLKRGDELKRSADDLRQVMK